MKAKEIRELSTEELEQRIQEEERDLGHLQFQHAIARIENPALLRQKRRLIARLKTIVNDRAASA